MQSITTSLFRFHECTPLYKPRTPVLSVDKCPHKFYFQDQQRWDAHGGQVVSHISHPISKIDVCFHHPRFVLHDDGTHPRRQTFF